LLVKAFVEEFFEVASHLNRFRAGGEITLFFMFHHSSLVNAPTFNLSTAAKFLVALGQTASLFFL
jgi:hypothetical protein